ncbi:dihydroorotate oxidase [Fructilactobacillus sanfranciscensis]|uniref:dihydroorotate oxidase n=1 Tax=Fructilactobacillus sanfranciscensis TaxID=1625 RepID=UPI000CD473A6|nr:dihydroorotate oxidase [Fructilactobacillus sanfranciscensis]MCG7195044.1 dihydroorotate oxidase [Fructilactobacillus sanfranciscensis]MCG7195626.1 dihydroorotate oxidase [Fructilactobacillus sanfranciscensis]MDN4462396.1 dihydroorotate oxidase [Fructilactobacillus sanfranciscensis]NDR60846.1 dihydroorotate oxidase [Fructilactobacillus sanfranciscensis]NDR61380.1 dihydroorotate oxidase [Fructilactobacillus sanfranciscensis]
MTDISIAATIGNEKYEHPFINAAGVYDETAAQMNEILDSQAGGVTTKSATLVSRPGNPLPRYFNTELGSINSMGLPNQGLDYYLNYIEETNTDKPIDLSISGTSMADNLKALKKVQSSNFNGLTELNLSCPNVIGKPQVGYDYDAIEDTLAAVFEFFTKPLGLKLPPYFDLQQYDAVASILNKYPLTYINAINSVGNGLVVDAETESVVIKPKGGFGGIGGTYIKPVALANVRAFRQRLNPEIKIIGTGGVSTGKDAFELILCGADIVEVGTILAKEGPAVFERLDTELKAIMEAKGYQKLSDFRGKLKEYQE